MSANDGKQLRLALAMRGGVSLAVWIGGAVAELDVLRRAAIAHRESPPGTQWQDYFAGADEALIDRADIYLDLLHQAGYDDVLIDVLAGASAGGLNAVIYGYAQSLGLDVEWLADVWRTEGDLWGLLRGTRPVGRVTSILDADAVFYTTVYQKLVTGPQLTALTTLTPDGVAMRGKLSTGHLSIDLSATALDPAQDNTLSLGGRDPGLTRRRPSTAGFSFRRRPAAIDSPLTDLPGPEDVTGPLTDHLHMAPLRRLLGRLALAARSTSSFPGAFEPAQIFSGPTSVLRTPGMDGFPQPSMRGVFSETRDDEEPTDIIDGGVFDNIPIGRALEAIKAAPADTPTARTVLYLDPSPPVIGSVPQPRSESATGFLGVVFRSLGLKQRVESADDEIELIRRHNEIESEARFRRDVLATQVAGVSAADPGPAYVRWRAARDAERLAELLTDPGSALLVGSVDLGPTPMLTQAAALSLREVIPAIYAGEACGLSPAPRAGIAEAIRTGLASDATSFIDAVGMLVAWVRALESAGGVARHDLAKIKSTLYRLREIGVEIRARGEAAIVATFLGGRGTTPDWTQLAPSLVEGMLAELAFAEPDSPSFAKALELADTCFYGWLRDLLVPCPPPVAVPRALTSAWDQLERMHTALGELAPVPPAGGSGSTWWWAESIFPWIRQQAKDAATAREVAMRLAAAGGAPGTTSTVRFRRITADEPVATALCTDGIATDELRDRVTGLLRSEVREAGLLRRQVAALSTLDRVNASSKLAGNQLGNFGGFLDDGWRSHDWHWGRADAAAGIVRWLAEEADRMKTDSPGQTTAAERHLVVEAKVGEVQKLLLHDRPFDGPKPALRDIAPVYRFAVASRIAHLVFRGVWPPRWTFRSLIGRATLVAARPVLMALPLVARPASLIWAIVAVLVTALPPAVPTDWPHSPLEGVARAGLALTGAITVTRALQAARKWSLVERAFRLAVADVPPELVGTAVKDGEDVAEWRRQRYLPLVSALLLGVAGMVLPLVSLIPWKPFADVPVHEWFWAGPWRAGILILGLVAVAQVLVTTARSAPRADSVPAPPAAVRREPVWIVLGSCLVLIACLPVTLRWVLPPILDLNRFVPGDGESVWLTGLAATLLLGLLHHGWAARGWVVAVPVAGGILAAFLATTTQAEGLHRAALVLVVVGIVHAFSTAFVGARPARPGRPTAA